MGLGLEHNTSGPLPAAFETTAYAAAAWKVDAVTNTAIDEKDSARRFVAPGTEGGVASHRSKADTTTHGWGCHVSASGSLALLAELASRAALVDWFANRGAHFEIP